YLSGYLASSAAAATAIVAASAATSAADFNATPPIDLPLRMTSSAGSRHLPQDRWVSSLFLQCEPADATSATERRGLRHIPLGQLGGQATAITELVEAPKRASAWHEAADRRDAAIRSKLSVSRLLRCNEVTARQNRPKEPQN